MPPEKITGTPLGMALDMLAQQVGGDDKDPKKNPIDSIRRAIDDLMDVKDKVPSVSGIIEDLQNLVEKDDTSERTE